MTSRRPRRIGLVSGTASVCAVILGALLAALGCSDISPGVAVVLVLCVSAQGVVVVLVGRVVERNALRRKALAEVARRRRLSSRTPTLPRMWVVPDYPPDDLQPPAS